MQVSDNGQSSWARDALDTSSESNEFIGDEVNDKKSGRNKEDCKVHDEIRFQGRVDGGDSECSSGPSLIKAGFLHTHY
jgi:hypothetical protein